MASLCLRLRRGRSRFRYHDLAGSSFRNRSPCSCYREGIGNGEIFPRSPSEHSLKARRLLHSRLLGFLVLFAPGCAIVTRIVSAVCGAMVVVAPASIPAEDACGGSICVVPGLASGVTSMMSIKLPLWVRFVSLVGVTILATGAGLFAYRYYTRPVTLSIAVGSIDGEAAKAMSAIASQLVSTNAPVRLKVIDSGTVLEAADAFAAGKVDLAVVRGDVGDLSQAQAVVVVSHV